MKSTAASNLKLSLALIGSLLSLGATTYVYTPLSANVTNIKEGADVNVHTEWEKSEGKRFRHTVFLYDRKGGNLLYASPTTHVTGGAIETWRNDFTLPWGSGVSRASFFIRVEVVVEKWQVFGYHDYPYTTDFSINRVNDLPSPREIETEKNYFTGLLAMYSDHGKKKFDAESIRVDKYKPGTHAANYRGIDISSQGLLFHGLDYDNDPRGDVTLYIYSYLEDFAFAKQTFFAGRRAREIPLVMSFDDEAYVGDIPFDRYRFLAKDYYQVDKTTLRMSEATPNKPSWNSFRSRDIFLPLGTGHDREPYSMALSFTNVGKAKCSFYFFFTVVNGDRFFGSCENSDYCVALGGKRNA